MLQPHFSRLITHLCSSMLVTLALFSLNATGQELKSIASADSPSTRLKVKLAAEDNWAPFADPYGKGLSHRLVKQAFSRVNVDVDSLVVSYARGLVMTKQGIVDGVFNLHKERKTQEEFVFGQIPLFTTSASFYQSNAHPLQAQSKWQLPEGLVVGIIKGYEYGDELAQLKQLRLVEVDNHNQLINLLLLNRIDAAIMYDEVANQYLAQMGVSKVIGRSVHNHTGDLYVAFSKLQPNAQLFADKLDQGLKALKQDGSYQTIMNSLLAIASK
ncbi:transporter substrate-binding domain-containing protein [Shewanella insulae]|uniref:substrate-binding periplasmic protein n=1 Tax=Shewanella insulae TaxID=2681496 RepID=UPI001EFEA1BA|nr:transporter substrate-binding domain-containing protein [Shewanella insulae]MCG9739925.1 transporter substrate-binding domain-containing protein [Shewanella insulae]